MIHIAAASEAKGRVIIQASCGAANPVVLDAAIWLALAFQSEIEGLYVEDQQLIDLARFPFASEISFSGRSKRAICSQDIERQFRFQSEEFHSAIEQRARAAELPWQARVVRDGAVNALIVACAARGPWNAVALAEPFTAPGCPSLKELFENVRDTTGLLLVGPNARGSAGPIVIALETVELLPAMLGAADRLCSVDERDILVCPIASIELDLAQCEGAARVMLAERPNGRLTNGAISRGAEGAVANAIARLKPGLVIGQYGGMLVPTEGDLRPLAIGLECPLLLMR